MAEGRRSIMGMKTGKICRDCGHRFMSMEGPGMFFAILRCEKCGAGVEVTIEEAGDAFEYGTGTRLPSDQGDATTMESIATAKHHTECGGRCTFDAPVRCPVCASTHLDEDPEAEMILYD